MITEFMLTEAHNKIVELYNSSSNSSRNFYNNLNDVFENLKKEVRKAEETKKKE